MEGERQQTLHEASSAALQRAVSKRRQPKVADGAQLPSINFAAAGSSYLPAPNQAPSVPQCGVAAARPEVNHAAGEATLDLELPGSSVFAQREPPAAAVHAAEGGVDDAFELGHKHEDPSQAANGDEGSDGHGNDMEWEEAEALQDGDGDDEDEDDEFQLQLQLPGASGSAPPSEEDLAARRHAARLRKYDRALQQLQHRVSALSLLGRGLLLDCAADLPAVQAMMLSLAPEGLLPPGPPAPCPAAALSAVADWMLQTFERRDVDFAALLPLPALRQVGGVWPSGQVVDVEEESAPDEDWFTLLEGDGGPVTVETATGVQLMAWQLLHCAHHRRGSEEHVTALFVALLRGAGLLVRSVSALRCAPLRPATAVGGAAAKRAAPSAPWRGAGRGAKRASGGDALRMMAARSGRGRKARGGGGKSPAARPAVVADAKADAKADASRGGKAAGRGKRASRAAAQADASVDVDAASGDDVDAATPEPPAKRTRGRSKTSPATKGGARKRAAAAGASKSASRKRGYDELASSGANDDEERAGPSGRGDSDAMPSQKAKSRGELEFEAQLAMALQATASAPGASTPQKPEGSAQDPNSASRGNLGWSRGGRAGCVHWAEVWCDSATTGRWVHVDPIASLVDAPHAVEESGAAGAVLGYVVAFQGGGAKDVTRRYARSFLRSLKTRDEAWWQHTVAPLRSATTAAVAAAHSTPPDADAAGSSQPVLQSPQAGSGGGAPSTPGKARGVSAAPASSSRAVADAPPSASAATPNGRTAAQEPAGWRSPAADASGAPTAEARRLAQLVQDREDAELRQKEMAERRGLPTSVTGFKNHEVYVLERHISRYQALLPGAKRLGLHKGEAYYDRSMLADLHSACRWRREGREVKASQLATPAKVVKTRGKSGGDAAPAPAEGGGDAPTGPTTDLYGIWQTDSWEPPAAVNGIVPKNDRGNVEAPPFAKALPGGTVHLVLPRLAQICRRLEIDYAPALVGFELAGGRMVPKINGVVICAESEAAVLQEHEKDESKRLEKARAKRFQQGRAAWLMVVNAVHARLQVQADVERQRLHATSTAMARNDLTQAAAAGGDAAAASKRGKSKAKAADKGAARPRKRKAASAALDEGGGGAVEPSRDASARASADGAAPKSLGATLRDRLSALGVRAEVEDI